MHDSQHSLRPTLPNYPHQLSVIIHSTKADRIQATLTWNPSTNLSRTGNTELGCIVFTQPKYCSTSPKASWKNESNGPCSQPVPAAQTLAVTRSSCNLVTLGSASRQKSFKPMFSLLLTSSPVASFIPLARALMSTAKRSKDTLGREREGTIISSTKMQGVHLIKLLQAIMPLCCLVHKCFV